MNTNTEKMVSRFRRTLSFPRPIEKSYHIRSVSLPTRSHPLISQVNHDIHHLQTWLLSHHQHTHLHSASAVLDGLIKLNNLHDSFHDLLQLPKTQESLARQFEPLHSLLDHFLVYIDVYGRFRAALGDLKQDQCSAQVAIRRRDESKIVLYLKNRKIIDKEIKKLASTVRKCPVSPEFSDLELAGVVADVKRMTVSMTTALLDAISGSSLKYSSCIGAIFLNKKGHESTRIPEFEQVQVQMVRILRKKGDEEVTHVLKKLEELENCIVKTEIESGKLFRSLMNTRVSLLNVTTQ